MLCGQRRRCTSTGSPAQNNGPCFWPALPSPPQLVPRGPPIVDHNKVAHHAVRSASTLHLHREPCSEQRALFLACPTLPPTVEPQGTPYCRSESGSPSCCAVGVDAAPPQGALLRTTGPVFGLPYPPPHSWSPGDPLLSITIRLPIMLCDQRRRCTSTGSPAQNNGPCFWPALPSPTVGLKRTPHCRSESGCPSCCAVGVDAAPPQGALLRTTGPVFGLPYPPPHSWAPGDPLLSIRIGLPIMLCGRRRRCTSTGSPPQNNGPCFWPALPSPPQLGPRGPPIVDQNRVPHHAVRSASTLHLHREPCSAQRALFLACPTLPPTVGPQGTPYCRSQ